MADRAQLDQADMAVVGADGLPAVLGVDVSHGGVAAGGIQAHWDPGRPSGAGAVADQRGLEGSGGCCKRRRYLVVSRSCSRGGSAVMICWWGWLP